MIQQLETQARRKENGYETDQREKHCRNVKRKASEVKLFIALQSKKPSDGAEEYGGGSKIRRECEEKCFGKNCAHRPCFKRFYTSAIDEDICAVHCR